MPTLYEQWAEEDRREGLIEGRQEGLTESLRAGITLALDLKFFSERQAVLAEIAAIEDVDRLRTILDAIRTTSSVEELRQDQLSGGAGDV